MEGRRLVAWWVALLVAALGLGCVPAPKAPVLTACKVEPGGPTFCQTLEGIFVVGLQPAAKPDRGDWMLLETAIPHTEPRQRKAAAMAVVTEVYRDAVRIHVLHQVETKLDGARARKVGKDERARLGKYVGRIGELDLKRMQIDVGKQDGVSVGDVYQVLSPRDHRPIGRVKVTEVGDLWAWGLVLDKEDELFERGLDVVWLKGATGEEVKPVSIVVVNFDPRDRNDRDEVKAGAVLAKDLADSLAKAAGGREGYPRLVCERGGAARGGGCGGAQGGKAGGEAAGGGCGGVGGGAVQRGRVLAASVYGGG
jgi:hypothetical protein